ncbi:three-helix bundle dimerization domain-containing protein [Streptomyces sp. NPDC051322]|uniref:three-helix bundle dimerization domain-containing protein n=1 Tax=Streptomyces sp. NPDC051322 TaxID=3154645 RepID=UPI0034502DCC
MTASTPPVLPDERLASGAARLATRHAGHFSAETVQELLADSYARLAETAKVCTHLVMPAERLTGERLDALAHTRAREGLGLARVLFVCAIAAVREIRDAIDAHITDLLTALPST